MYEYKRTLAEKTGVCINYILLSALTISTLYPFIYFLVLSLNDGMDAMKGGIYLWPRMFTLDNYVKAFQNKYILDSYSVTLFRTVVGTLISVFLNSMVAYALTKKNLPGRGKIIFYFFFTTLFSGGLIPYYILLRQLGFLDTIWVYVIPTIFNFYNIIIMRTYFQTIPDSLSESAAIDGSSEVGIFFKIYLPLSAPMLSTIALFFGVGHWNDWFIGTFFVTDMELKPTATLLQQILTEAGFQAGGLSGTSSSNINNNMTSDRTTPEALRMTFLVITTLPIIMIYPFLQKYFVSGVMLGSLKE